MQRVEVIEGNRVDLRAACELWFLADEGPATDDNQRRAVVQSLAAEMSTLWDRPPVHLFLATAASQLVGSIFGKPRRDDPQTGQISLLAVHPAWQRQGVGQLLLDAALNALAHDGCQRCRAYVVASDATLQRFYEKRGWTFTGEVDASPHDSVQERVFLKPL